jgi:hypothetical protein
MLVGIKLEKIACETTVLIKRFIDALGNLAYAFINQRLFSLSNIKVNYHESKTT